MNDDQKHRVLFLCTGNSARSILGEYLLRSMDPRFEAWSAGAEPTGKVHPMALQVLRDAYGIDASGAESKSWEAVQEVDFDVVITVCGHARDTCPGLPESPAIQAHWGSPDPAEADGHEAEAVFRQVAAQIHRRLERFCALPLEGLLASAPLRGDERAELAARIGRIGNLD